MNGSLFVADRDAITARVTRTVHGALVHVEIGDGWSLVLPVGRADVLRDVLAVAITAGADDEGRQ